jgi:hypothetical protein
MGSNKKLINLLFLLLAVAAFYLVSEMVAYRAINIVDILVAMIGVGFIAYGIGFLSKLES